jgi:hypothetical protein
MADRKISDLTALTTPASGDFLPIVDISEAAAASKNKRITIEELFRGVPLGSAAAPSIAIEGDEDTGVFSPGANQLAVSTGGTERLRIDATGTALLKGTERLAFNTYVSDANHAGYIGRNTSTGALVIEAQNAGGGYPITFRTNSLERLRITDAGLVGIGTSSPTQIISANGNIKVQNSTVSTKGFVFDSPASNWSPQESGLYFVPADGVNGRADFKISLWNGIGGTPDRFYINGSSGNVGIGTTSPAENLTISSNVAATTVVGINAPSGQASKLQFKRSDTNRINIECDASDNLKFYSDASAAERFRCDSSGRLLVGTSTSRSTAFGAANFQIESGGPLQSITQNGANGYGAAFVFAKTRGAAFETVINNDNLGILSWQGSNGSALLEGARYYKQIVDGVVSGGGANDLPTRLVFSTTADGAASPTERMRINNAGAVLIGVTSDNYLAADSGIQLNANGTARFGTDGTSAANVLSFVNGTNGTPAEVGAIQTSGSSTSYNTSSDYRLKENVVPLTNAVSRLNQLRVHRFNFIADPGKTVDGFIAHEAQAVVPECATGTKDAVNEDGNPVYQGIDQSKLVPLLTAALQEAIAKIETLEAKVAALEAQ